MPKLKKKPELDLIKEENLLRRFALVDETSAIVAHGIVWDDWSCSIRWYGDKEHFSTVHWPNAGIAAEQSFGQSDQSVPFKFMWIDA